MSYGMTGGKRQREANRDRKKKEKQERLRRNRELRAQGVDTFGPPEAPAAGVEAGEKLPEIKLEDIVISGVAPREKGRSVGPTKLFVGGLSWETDNAELEAAFAQFGPLADAAVVTDRYTGRSRGFGFVTFQNAGDAATAAKEMDGAELDGRTLKVNAADQR